MILKKIRIKGLRNITDRTISFDSGVNYFWGPNGAGKSTILNAIQLAVLGYIPGKYKTNAAIMKNSNGNVIEISATFDATGTEVTVNRMWVRKGSSTVTSDVTIDPPTFGDISYIVKEFETPVFNFEEFAAMSSNMKKDFFVAHLVESSKSKETLAKSARGHIKCSFEGPLEESKQAQMLESFESLGFPKDWNNPVSLDLVRDAETWVKSTISAKNAEQERVASTLASLVKYEDLDDTLSKDSIHERESVIQATLQEVRDWQTKKASYDAYQVTLEENKDLIKRFEGITSIEDVPEVKEHDKTSKAYDDICVRQSEEKEKLRSKGQEVSQKIAEINASITGNKKIIDSKGVCNFTQNPCEPLSGMVADLEQENIKLSEKLEVLQKEYDKLQQDIEAVLVDEVADVKAKYIAARDARSKAQNDYLTARNILNRKIEEPKSMEHVDVEALQKELSECTDNLAKIKANEIYESTYNKLYADNSELGFQLEVLKILKSYFSANGLQQKLTEGGFLDAQKDLEQYISAMFDGRKATPAFHLSSKANSFSFGLNIDGTYIPFEYLSKGEQCLYMIGFMAYVINKDVGGVNILLVDDSLDHLDERASEMLFRCITDISEKFDIQCIFAGVYPIKNPEMVNCVNVCIRTDEQK